MLSSAPKVLAYPNGSIVTTDPKTCRIALVRDGTQRWDHELGGCGGLLEASVTMDSTLYVRDLKNLSSFDPEGALRWAVRLTDAPPQNTLATPAELADSRVALATTAKSVVVYERDGRVSWTFSPPSDETLAAAPVGMKTEGIILVTNRAAYYLSSAGEVRWRVAGQY
jgi:outer membrane protein assembly factor BamB